MTRIVLAEKPSVARDIAQVVGARTRVDGALRGNGWVVTWAIGHLVSVAQPHEMQAEWRRWSFDRLPMIPVDWKLEVYERTRDQFEIVSRLLNDPDSDEIVCATDAGREGELIFRYIYEKAGCTKPVRRLWISSLTPEAIRLGLDQLRDGADYDPLADAARGRSRADWLVGLNLSRAYSLASGDSLSVGRVQTPTLAMLVERTRAIEQFEPEDYHEVLARFAPSEKRPASGPGDYFGVFVLDDAEGAGEAGQEAPAPDSKSTTTLRDKRENGEADGPASRHRGARLPADGVRAREVAERAMGGRARIADVEARQSALPPPALYDLTELQRHANRLFGFSAQRTLDLAQELYERKKLLSYPRTDSRHLTEAIARELPGVVAAVAPRYGDDVAPDSGRRPLGRRFVDDTKIGDHHAILPTAKRAAGLTGDQERIYDLVCRRLLSAWHEDHRTSTTTVTTLVETTTADGHDVVDRYRSTGRQVDQIGWKVLDPPTEVVRPAARLASDPASPGAGAAGSASRLRSAFGQELPPGLAAGDAVRVEEAEAARKKTRPPPYFSEASLLTAMETAGRTLEERELSEAMRDTGLGTPATRASIIETLLARGYVERRKKSLIATAKGTGLVDVVHPEVKSPAMTGQWEAQLAQVKRGNRTLAEFMAGIEQFVRETVGRIGTDPTAARSAASVGGRAPGRAVATATPRRAADRGGTIDPPVPSDPPIARQPTAPDALDGLLKEAFGFDAFRPYQDATCRAVTRGEDVLLVMPTGAGKSLCYQLPGLARAGTTLVVSPLIALMEDQVAALCGRGLRAERIHSGRSRPQARAVCQAYLQGALDFLFIAPERLAVPGFPELLARRKPTLVAIDEAHCISQWGHDFRPDYRMLRERLPALRPAPILALTATATPDVQRDIVEQLGVPEARRFIHGFRRDNLAIEVVETATAMRDERVASLLDDRERRPAIVYAPTRKKADALAQRLGRSMRAAAYHAGMTGPRRDQVQAAFLAGDIEVIVATIAFGMGIDKPDVRTVVHAALPASVEGYYQEIGRAGRDGLPSRAVLLHGYADRRTHEWFLERDYPDAATLERIHRTLDETPRAVDEIRVRSGLDEEPFEKALEKLWVHGGASVSPDDRVTRGSPAWQVPYEAQRRHRQAQLARVARFASHRACRMLDLVAHFGDREDDGRPCGRCDVCAPSDCVALTFAAPSPGERRDLAQIVQTLAARGPLSVGRLHREAFADPIPRADFERLFAGLVRARLVSESTEQFERAGETISYRSAVLTSAGRRAGDPVLAAVSLEPVVETQRSRPARRPSAARKTGPQKAAPPRSGARGALLEGTGGAPPALVEALRDWRVAEARKRRTPAFRVLSNRALLAIAGARPGDEEALLGLPGIGPTLARKHGETLLALVRRHATS